MKKRKDFPNFRQTRFEAFRNGFLFSVKQKDISEKLLLKVDHGERRGGGEHTCRSIQWLHGVVAAAASAERILGEKPERFFDFSIRLR